MLVGVAVGTVVALLSTLLTVLWPGEAQSSLLDGLPASLAYFPTAPEFQFDGLFDATVCVWREKEAKAWQCGPVEFASDGSDARFSSARVCRGRQSGAVVVLISLRDFDTSKISRWPFVYAGTIPMPEQTPGSGRTITPLPWTQPPDLREPQWGRRNGAPTATAVRHYRVQSNPIMPLTMAVTISGIWPRMVDTIAITFPPWTTHPAG
ncbi:hypothetical protein JS756_30560 [Streptomyces actuosus]|uniref:Uncharacterized protein n=1 Tax=Streptomyces actuosus TaxID=1885 RepID=A0ABS2VZB2_STRAS|nr:hypothetical protein [Streptomyces actuosus]MBN0048374.1 hypothetical protein [Streptomyces actuosus]